MYDELIKLLRETSIDFGESDHVSVMLIEAADAIEELAEERDMYIKAMADEHNRAARLAWEHRWIPVTERLPEDGSLLGKLICDSNGQIRIANQHATVKLKSKTIHTDLIDLVKFLEQEAPATEWDDCTHITHWMPLPQPPESEGE